MSRARAGGRAGGRASASENSLTQQLDQPLRQPAVSSRLRVGREGAELRDLHTVGYKDSSPLHEAISGPSRPANRWPVQPTWDESILLTASTRAEDHGAAGYRLRGPTKPTHSGTPLEVSEWLVTVSCRESSLL
ncbi:hypothetical protein ACRRTK_022259 [Alexandromys fortis]